MGLFSFKAFLSHRYRSTEINLYFFELFKEIAEVQFEVDDKVSKVEIAVNETSVNKAVETVTIIDPNSSANSEPKSENTVRANIKKPTNVTRLERMLRDADAFIGIYPFPGSSEEAQNNTKLKEESKYFRLEIDLAIRSHKPAIIFCDKRYIDIIKPPTNILYCPFDVNDVTGPGGRLQAGKHKRFIAEFCEQVKVRKEYDILHNKGNKTVVGLMFSSHPHSKYSPQCREKIIEVLQNHNYTDVREIKHPPKLDRSTFNLIEKLDLAIVDVGMDSTMMGVTAYLHGRFIPMIRLRHCDDSSFEKEHCNKFLEFLFGGVEVGYMKDLLEWDNLEKLEELLISKLELINAPVKRIKTSDEAEKHFRSAALKEDTVFLSYSGEDRDVGADFSKELKKYFRSVFDYRDGKSIRPGLPWMEEIFNVMKDSAIGIQLISSPYFKSGNCEHEAFKMVERMDAKKMKLFPVKVRDEPGLQIPEFMNHLQYIRLKDHERVESVVQEIVNRT